MTEDPSSETAIHGAGCILFQGGKPLGEEGESSPERGKASPSRDGDKSSGGGFAQFGIVSKRAGIATNRVGEALPDSGLRPNEWGGLRPTRESLFPTGAAPSPAWDSVQTPERSVRAVA